MLRFRFPRSRSKYFDEVIGLARTQPGFREEKDFYWIEFSEEDCPGTTFRTLSDRSSMWKGAAFLIGEEEVDRESWWREAEPLGKKLRKNTEEGWIEDRLWLEWGKPHNLIVGESHRQATLRISARVPEHVVTLRPVEVTYLRDKDNSHDPNAVEARIEEFHQAGFLPRHYASTVGPKMDEFGIEKMSFAGIMSGSDNIGVHVWPERALSDAVWICNPSSSPVATFHQYPEDVYEEYLRALNAKPEGCGSAAAAMVALGWLSHSLGTVI